MRLVLTLLTQAPPIQSGVAYGIVALPGGQAGATRLIASTNIVSSVTAGTGVRVDTYGNKLRQRIENAGSLPLLVYPPVDLSALAYYFQGLAPGAPLTLRPGEGIAVSYMGGAQWRVEWGGWLFAANNLSDVASPQAAWENLGGGEVGQLTVGAGLTKADGVLSADVWRVAGRTGYVTLTTADIGGAGNSITRNVGTGPGTVAAGNDTRIVNAVQTSIIAQPNGLATLDAGGKLTISQWPADITTGMTWMGFWNADTNTPTLVSGVGTNGHFYQVNVAGDTNLDGETTWEFGDQAVFTGGTWKRNALSTVFGTLAFQDAADVTVVDITITGNAYIGSDRFTQSDDRIPGVAQSWTNLDGDIVLFIGEDGTLNAGNIRTRTVEIGLSGARDTLGPGDDRIPGVGWSLTDANGNVILLVNEDGDLEVQGVKVGRDFLGKADERMPGLEFTLLDANGNAILAIMPDGSIHMQDATAQSVTVAGDALMPADERLGDVAFSLVDPNGNAILMIRTDGSVIVQSVGVGGDTYGDADQRIGDFPYTWFDRNGNAILTVDQDGNVTVQELQARVVRLSGAIVDPKQAVTKEWVEDLITDPVSELLEPSRDFGAPTDGSTNASTQVNACMAAAIAAGARFFAVQHTYNVPQLSRIAGDLFPIGPGALINSPVLRPVIPADAPPPPVLEPTFFASKHCSLAASAAAGGTLKIVVYSDSVGTPQVNGMSYVDTVNGMLKRAFQLANPGVAIEWINLGIGGMAWQFVLTVVTGPTKPEWYTDPDKIWLTYGEEEEADIILFNFGRNGSASFIIKHIRDVVAEIETWAKVPAVVVINSMGESQTESTLSVTAAEQRDRYLYATMGIASWAQATGHGLLNSAAAFNLATVGFSPDMLPLTRDGAMIGGMIEGNYDVVMPWTAVAPVYGWGGIFRIGPGDWATMGNELSFQIGAARTDGAEGCRFWLKRHPETFAISFRITVSRIAEGADEDYTFVDWTAIGVTCTDAQFFSWTFYQRGPEVYFGLQTPGSSPAEPVSVNNTATIPFHGPVPRCGGLYLPTITCASGIASNVLTWLPNSDGWSGVMVQVPHPRCLSFPIYLDKEFASPDTDPYAPWGGGGPHAGTMATRRILGDTFNTNQFTV